VHSRYFSRQTNVLSLARAHPPHRDASAARESLFDPELDSKRSTHDVAT